MKFNNIFTEEKYTLHLEYLKDYNKGKRLDLSYADLRNTDLSNAHLSYANLRETNLSNANLSYANMREVNLIGANLKESNLEEVKLSRVNLRKANLRKANLSKANLSGAHLNGADLSKANLSGADLIETSLNGADLSEANLSGADLRWITCGNTIEVWKLDLGLYIVVIVYPTKIMHIGCKTHSFEEWFSFSDEEIDKMSEDALKWRTKFKPILKRIIEIQ